MSTPVRWRWACKEFDEEKAELKMKSGMYYLVHEEGKKKILGFRYVCEPENMPLPNGVYFMQNDDIIAKLDRWQEKKNETMHTN